jgi:hypothetical protein
MEPSAVTVDSTPPPAGLKKNMAEKEFFQV